MTGIRPLVLKLSLKVKWHTFLQHSVSSIFLQDIEPGEELLTWYEKTPLRKRKGKRRTVSHGKTYYRQFSDYSSLHVTDKIAFKVKS